MRGLEALAQVGWRRGIGEPRVERLSGSHEVELPADRLRVIGKRVAAAKQQHRRERGEGPHAKPPCKRNRAASRAAVALKASSLCASWTSVRKLASPASVSATVTTPSCGSGKRPS